jgi:GT2 family glycosyltransferase
MTKKIEFSIIIPVKELNYYLDESIPKIFEMDFKNFEIIILPNDEVNNLPDYINNKKIRIVETGKVSPAVKRDIGAKNAKGEYLAFLDDDAYPQKDWLKVAEEEFEKTKAAAVCGPAVTPKNSSFFQEASGLFFESIFGSGPTNHRDVPAKKSFYVDDFPSVNLIVNKKIFLEIGGFKSEFWPGEDTKFCLDLVNSEHKIWYSNKLIVYHHRRKNLRSHLKQIGNYGKHRGYFAGKFEKNSFRIGYFVPTFFTFGNLGLLFFSVWDKIFLWIWSGLLLFYFLLLGIDIARLTKNRKLWFATIGLTFLSHLVYGWKFFIGFLMGIFRIKLKSELR